MKNQFEIRSLLADHPIVPVVNIEDLTQVDSIIERLIAQDIRCIEITLRSAVAMKAIQRALKIAPKTFSVGVGTIVSPTQVKDCARLGVDFMVSPGLTDDLSIAFDSAHIPFLPGVMTPSEIVSAMQRGYDTLKLFPFNLAGGITALKTYGNVFPEVKFCPTGGLNENNCDEAAALPNVICVGGSWVLK